MGEALHLAAPALPPARFFRKPARWLRDPAAMDTRSRGLLGVFRFRRRSFGACPCPTNVPEGPFGGRRKQLARPARRSAALQEAGRSEYADWQRPPHGDRKTRWRVCQPREYRPGGLSYRCPTDPLRGHRRPVEGLSVDRIRIVTHTRRSVILSDRGASGGLYG
jgi:hypothetical protein